jgi:hypothetical protein
MGCQTTAEQQAAVIAQDDAKCLSFGAPKGSQAYFDCRMTLERDRSQVAASSRFAERLGRQGTLTGLIEQAQ